MARHKEFDIEQTLDRAVDLLWRQGFEKTSIQDLVDHLGVGRGSLYATFGDKRGLYLAALDRYRERAHAGFAAMLAGADGVVDAFEGLMEAYVDEILADPECRGCFLTNATTELAARDPEVGLRVAANREHIIQTFHRALERAKKQGEISIDKRPLALARFFFNTLQGLRVTAKTTPDRATLRDIAAVALTVLR